MTIMITIDFISKKYNYFKNKKNIRYIFFLLEPGLIINKNTEICSMNIFVCNKYKIQTVNEMIKN